MISHVSPQPASSRQRAGLATRASFWTAATAIVIVILCAVTVLAGFELESRRQQALGARDFVDRLANVSARALAAGNAQSLSIFTRYFSDRPETSAAILADSGGVIRSVDRRGGASAIARGGEVRAIQQALRTGRVLVVRTPDGGYMATGPILHQGRVVGAGLVSTTPQAFRYDLGLTLAPLLLLLACLVLAGAPLAALVVRRALSPLDTLTRFAQCVAEKGETRPVSLRTGDEFETLANAFNNMLERLDLSMRKIQQIAFVDPVTQLPNQDRFQREVDFFILSATGKEEIGAVLVCELQRLPGLLHTLDPSASRDLLRLIAERMTIATRNVDRLVRLDASKARPAIAARLALSDFAVFAPGVTTPAEAVRFAQQLNAALNQPFDWRGHKLSLGAACGVALAQRDGKDADSVIRHARLALAAARGLPARLKVFTQSLDREAVGRLALERDLRDALDRNEFRAYFQPKINLATGRIEGAEALARWVKPDRTIISPARFIPLAEESGLIVPLSEAVMREACWKAAAWARAGVNVNVAVNVSALQFRNERFAEQVLHTMRHAGLTPSQLELEITESVAMEDAARAQRVIAPLREAGVRLAIDDFGCGHSSLAALSQLPFDVIKIDQHFTRSIDRGDAQGVAIVEMILALGGALGLEIVAEGVERGAQADFLARRGCHMAQGFLYGAAVPAAQFGEMLMRQAETEARAVSAA